MRRVWARAALLASLWTLASSAPVRAQDAPRVVLVGRDATLEAALHAALAPWHVALVTLEAPSPGASMPAAVSEGARIADAEHADAVVWVSRDAEGAFALWTYDHAHQRVLARPLPVGPPFDEASADSVALAIKTLLRHSDAAPASERLVEPPSTSEVRVELGGGVRAFAASPEQVEPRATVGLSFWPRALGSILGVALVVRGGTGLSVERTALDARLWTFDVALGLRGRFVIVRELDVTFGLDIGALTSWLDGRVLTDMHHVSDADVGPGALVWAEIGVRPLAALRIALRVGALVNGRTRTYLVRGEAQADTRPAALDAELLLEVPIDGGALDAL
jgi:hypothetical protein